MNWKWRVSHARGYRELGLLKEAQHELKLVPEKNVDETDVIAEHAALSQELGAWKKLADACRTLARRHADDPGWWIMWAYGTRRSESLTAAEKILLEAEALHADNATIQFNLGCYACQLGNLGAAQARVQRAISLDKNFAAMAQTDADLEPLRKIAAKPWA
jgi:tetratricopeptide (TPR) repeat protein